MEASSPGGAGHCLAAFRAGQKAATYASTVLLCGVLLCGALLLGSCKESAAPPLKVLGAIPDFSLTTQENKPFTRESMLGKVSIANFIFTRCPTVCPVFSMKMQRIGERTPASIELLSFSVDPAYDTPERLTEYASHYQADPARWHFLTGDPKLVRDTVEGALKIAMPDQGASEGEVPDIVHGVHFVLFDGKGRIRGYYNSDDIERIDQLVRDATSLARQSAK